MMQGSLRQAIAARASRVGLVNPVRASGTVTDFVGLLIESEGPPVSVGDLCDVETSDGGLIRAEVVGFRQNRVLSMPLEETGGLRLGGTIVARREAGLAPLGRGLLGRVVDAFGHPIDGSGALIAQEYRPLYEEPPGPMLRQPIDEPFVSGIRVIDALLPCGKGQRVGIFGGSGVGKSTLLAAMARNGQADVNVIALIGERNREVRGFIEETLGPEGLKKSIVVVATSERPAPVRVRATFFAAAVSDWFREQGADVLLIMDSVTRFAMAQREIGLAAGEPPSQKGYTPSVFQSLPKVFERAGNFPTGSVTGFYTVLVEGDDMNDPIADAARSLLDGHIVLSRDLASANHFPAIDALESVSRLAQAVADEEHLAGASVLRDSMAAYRRSEDLVNLGAYTAGSNLKLDRALQSRGDVEAFLKQDISKSAPIESTLEQLRDLAERV